VVGAPKGRIRTFTEVQFKGADGRTCIPDGAVVIERGRRVCIAFDLADYAPPPPSCRPRPPRIASSRSFAASASQS